MPPTAKRQLLAHLYDGDLDADVEDFLAAGLSWRQIAATVSKRSGVTVSYETLRTWFGQDAVA